MKSQVGFCRTQSLAAEYFLGSALGTNICGREEEAGVGRTRSEDSMQAEEASSPLPPSPRELQNIQDCPELS